MIAPRIEAARDFLARAEAEVSTARSALDSAIEKSDEDQTSVGDRARELRRSLDEKSAARGAASSRVTIL